jgi:hypothetical protein
MAARMVLNLSSGSRLDSTRVELATDLVIRDSTAPPPRRQTPHPGASRATTTRSSPPRTGNTTRENTDAGVADGLGHTSPGFSGTTPRPGLEESNAAKVNFPTLRGPE